MYCVLVSVPWYKGGNPTCDRLKKNWVCCGNTYFFKEFLNKKLSKCFVPECLYGLIVEGLILTALCMQGPSFLPGGRFSPRGVTGGLRAQVIEKVCPRLRNIISHSANWLWISLLLYELGRNRNMWLIFVHTVAELKFGSNSDHSVKLTRTEKNATN